MDNIRIVKGRERIYRGRLISFFDLPEEKQKIFKEIKTSINELLKEKLDVYLFGSYIHGYWDEFSDFDVYIVYGVIDISLSKEISRKLGVKVDIHSNFNPIKNILIP